MSQFVRAWTLARTRALSEILKDNAAIVAHSGHAHTAGPCCSRATLSFLTRRQTTAPSLRT